MEEQQRRLGSKNREVTDKIEELRKRLLSDESIRQKISFRAYEIFQRRGGAHGRPDDDWLQAENEILSPLIEQGLGRAPLAPPAKTSQSAAAEKTAPPVKTPEPAAAEKTAPSAKTPEPAAAEKTVPPAKSPQSAAADKTAPPAKTPEPAHVETAAPPPPGRQSRTRAGSPRNRRTKEGEHNSSGPKRSKQTPE